MAALSVDVLAKTFPPLGEAPAKAALDRVSFSASPGEVLAVVGPSGCGKTTLLNIVAGLDRSFQGQVDVSPDARIAYVFQEPRLLPWRTVEDNLRLVLDQRDAEQRIAAILVDVGLAGAAGVFASRLSLGMARRVALARAFVVAPDILLLDEPFASLDAATARRLRLQLQKLLEARRTSAILVTHDLTEAVMLADRLLLLSPSPGRCMGEVVVPLDAAARRDEAAVEAFRKELLASGRIDRAAAVGTAT